MEPDLRERIVGCLIAGALGDAQGSDRSGSTSRTSSLRVTALCELVLCACGGLLHADLELSARGMSHPASCVASAWDRWRARSGGEHNGGEHRATVESSPWLVNELRRNRDSRQDSSRASWTSGRESFVGLCSAIPSGLITPAVPPGAFPEEAMALGREIASLTPSDPETIETAGLLAAIIHCVAGGLSIGDALERCRGLSSSSLGRVIDLASQGGRPRPRGGPAIDDALADRDASAQMFGVALACALHASDVAAGIEAAWPLGDQGSATRSTLGWIAGSLLGAERGLDEVPPAFIERLDAADVVLAVAHDCASWEVERPDPRVPSEVFTRLFERYVATDGGTGVT